ncbi:MULTISPECIES: DNA-processing protein DprA [Providencia]|uniref:DNA protecting protein DprA n=3 Tax=Providencia rustigianii TaxID=158850 RepID=A0A379G8H6_9GAMM|nr:MULTISPECIES: DNA-processing protein DprA [Providencia]MTC56481.1 DNA-protecting protein DprA [Providencia rustigianii]SPY79218.1 DNA protecting protein DprA [Providencia rustigianii]SUC28896.1 DNA protecting protein DprA [Providencia rustigianii]SUC37192.1 DNA protecting protein DprA [Providencia rustigianii]
MNEQEIWIRLSLVNKVALEKVIEIISYLKQRNKVTHSILKECGLNEMQRLQFFHVPQQRIEITTRWLQNKENQMITVSAPQYPFLLKQTYNPPLLLFVIGNSELLSDRQIAIVGSRQMTEYGKTWTKNFVKKFISYGLTITSGLALGIDGASHKTALEHGGKTVAVLGSGLANVYPKQHYNLADEIKENGLLVSEYLPDTPPLPKQFPRRNRIISGLSKAVVVIEAGMKSGSLITARYAIEQNRDLFTLPAPLGNPAFSGNHWLVQQGAYLLSEPDDILLHLECSLNWIQPELSIESTPNSEFNLTENRILGMVGYQVTPVDVIAGQLQLPISRVISILTELEISGDILSTAGGYIRVS